jgi:hypothetical protein
MQHCDARLAAAAERAALARLKAARRRTGTASYFYLKTADQRASLTLCFRACSHARITIPTRSLRFCMRPRVLEMEAIFGP